jgi:hypothetical protein
MLNNEAGMLESFFQMHHLHTHTYKPYYLASFDTNYIKFLNVEIFRNCCFYEQKFVKEIIESSRIFLFVGIEINYWMDVCPSCQGATVSSPDVT